MPFPSRRPAAAAVAVAAGLLCLPAAAPAKKADKQVKKGSEPVLSLGAKDYTSNPGLSQPSHDETEQLELTVPAFDGAELYIEVTKPKAAGRYPVILEASPYHGTLADREGTRILPEPRDADGRSVGLTGYFAPRGYAVVMMDLRGTGRSRGCLDHLGLKDARDLRQIVEWAATQDWSNGRVGMTGHSYVGSTPSVAAAQRPKGLATIVPSAGLASMYDHQFQAGVPYWLQWAGPMEAYEQIALERKLPGGDDGLHNMEDTGCGLPQSSLVAHEDQLSGRYARWHEERDWTDGATKADIPVFMVHGVNDNAARVAAMQWFTDRGNRAGDKIWLGQWDHGSGCCPTRRGIQWTYALQAWFDKHLAGRDVDTGPAVEAFLADSTFEEARKGARTEILTADGWPGAPATRTLTTSAADGLVAADAQAGSRTFAGDARHFLSTTGTTGATFSTAPLTEDVVLAGVPDLRLSASVSTPRVHLIATLYDEREDGNRRRITQCALNPELRNGIARRDVVVPGQRYDMAPPCFAMAHHVRAGHKLVLRVSTADPDKVPTFANDPRVTVFTGAGATAIDLPVVESPTLVADDVPLELAGDTYTGPAAPPLEATTTTAAPGAGVRNAATSQYVEFTVPENSDTASAEIRAIPSLPADLDLYLQRKRSDGTWSGDLASGASGDLDKEILATGRLVPGTYRLEVHNWAGPAGNTVKVTGVFTDSEGVAGT